MKIETSLAIANKKNLNGRIYSTEVLNKMVNQFNNMNKPLLGELGMPSESVTLLSNASHKIDSIKIKKYRLPRRTKKLLKKQGLYINWKNNNSPVLFGTIETLDTPNGELVKKMFENKSAVIRSRGTGSINSKGYIQDYSLFSFDIISKDDDAFKDVI